MILLTFSGFLYLRINWLFLIVLVSGFVVFALWILLGFPQFFAPGYSSSFTGYRDVIAYPISYRTLVGYLANSFSKSLVIAPALLFAPKDSMTPTLTRIWRRIVRTVW